MYSTGCWNVVFYLQLRASWGIEYFLTSSNHFHSVALCTCPLLFQNAEILRSFQVKIAYKPGILNPLTPHFFILHVVIFFFRPCNLSAFKYSTFAPLAQCLCSCTECLLRYTWSLSSREGQGWRGRRHYSSFCWTTRCHRSCRHICLLYSMYHTVSRI